MAVPTIPPPPFDPALDTIDQLRAVGREFHGRGWSLGTSSNYSVVAGRAPLELTITVSGKDKSVLARDDFVRVDAAGVPCDGSGRKSSAETLLHCLVAELVPSVGAVLHTHSVWSTILSRADGARGAVRIEGYEMLKGLDGIVTHDTCEEVPIFANAQAMPELASRIRARFLAADWSDPKRPPFHVGPRPRRGPAPDRDPRVPLRGRRPHPLLPRRRDRDGADRPAAVGPGGNGPPRPVDRPSAANRPTATTMTLG